MKILALIFTAIFLISGCVGQTAEVAEVMPTVDDISEGLPLAGKVDEIVEEVMEETIEEPGEPSAQVVEIDMIARQWEFVPARIDVNEGDTVKLHITSEDVEHGIFISAFGIRERLEPGQTVDIEFVADKKGSHSFVCSVFCGSGHSRMTGTINVN